MQSTIKRWVIVIIAPIFFIAWTLLFPEHNPTDYMMNGIIMACVAVFLAKYVLFAAVFAHLKQNIAERKQAFLQFIPLIVFMIYIVWYFLHS